MNGEWRIVFLPRSTQSFLDADERGKTRMDLFFDDKPASLLTGGWFPHKGTMCFEARSKAGSPQSESIDPFYAAGLNRSSRLIGCFRGCSSISDANLEPQVFSKNRI